MAQAKLVFASSVFLVVLIISLDIRSIEGSRHLKYLLGNTNINIPNINLRPQLITKGMTTSDSEDGEKIAIIGNGEGVITTTVPVPPGGATGAVGQSRRGLYNFKPNDPGHSPGVGQSLNN